VTESDKTSTLTPKEASAGPWLLVVDARGTAQAHALEPGTSRLTLGRSRTCDVMIDDASVSRQHAMIHLGAVPRIENLGGSNGVLVRGKSLDVGAIADLAVGEIAQLGAVLVAIQAGSAYLPQGRDDRTRRLPALERTANAWDDGTIVAIDPATRTVLRLVERVANSTISVLLTGETGVGKEIFAHAIHRCSPRAGERFVRINCAALPASLAESELFGHARGAFTDASRDKEGLVESASGGTVFLDEVGDLPLDLQPKLLRVLEERMLQRIGETAPRPIDVRFIAATNRNLRSAIAEGRFRDDLYYRLNGVSIHVPPLRERRDDIARLALRFVARARGIDEPEAATLWTRDALKALYDHSWPGNVRELRNAVEHAALIAGSGAIEIEHLPADVREHAQSSERTDPAALREDVKAYERARVLEALARFGGNQTRAARALGISRRTLVTRLDEYGVARPRKPGGG